MKPMFKFLRFCTLIALVGSCSPAPAFKKSDSNSTLKDSREPLDPANSKAIVGTLALTPATQGSRFQVPGFSLNLKDADFAIILRCNANYVLKATDGFTAVSSISPEEPRRREQMRWAFLGAQKAFSECQTIGTKIARSSFTDIAAPSGKYYYVINPCVDEDRTTDLNNACSHDLMITEFISYKNVRQSEEIKVAKEMAMAEGTLYGNFSELQQLARLIKIQQETCESNWAAEQANKEIQAGLMKIAGTVAGIALNTVAMGAGTVLAEVVGMIADATNQPTAIDCPDVRLSIQKVGTLKTGVQASLKGVLDARQKLAALNSEIAPLDKQVSEYFAGFNNGPAVSGTP